MPRRAFPIWSRCLYDAGTAAPRVLDIAQRTHPRVVLPSGLYQPSRRYQDPAVFEPLPPDPDPLERLVPALVLADPSAFQARQAVTSIGYGRLATRSCRTWWSAYPRRSVTPGDTAGLR